MEANNKAIREALAKIQQLVTSDSPADEVEIANICRAALAKPLRNCDMGTAEEQSERWWKFCEKHFILSPAKDNCAKCPIRGTNRHCELAWAQLPYESEVKK